MARLSISLKSSEFDAAGDNDTEMAIAPAKDRLGLFFVLGTADIEAAPFFLSPESSYNPVVLL